MKRINNNINGFGAVELLVVIVAVVAIGGLGWYAWQSGSAKENNNQSAKDTEQPEEAQPEVLKTGTFKNVGEKTGSGSASLLKNVNGSHTVRLEDDFTVQKGPALYVAFGNGETYGEGTAFAPLKELTGKQEYSVPSSVDINEYSSIIIWCEEFSVAFAAAELK